MTGSLRTTAVAALATVLAALSLVPAFREGQHWLAPSVLTVVLVAGTGYAIRRLGVPRLLVPVAQLVVLAWVFLLVYAPEGTRWGFLPSADSVQHLTNQVELGLEVITRFAAPVPSGPEIALTTTIGVGLVAVLTDLLAATFRLTPWAGLPLLLLYSVPATTVDDGLTLLAFVPAAVGYLLLLGSDARERLAGWGRSVSVTDGRGPNNVSLSLFGPTGRRVGVAALGLAAVIPALLPTMPEGILPDSGSGGGFGSDQRRTLRVDNPMVDLRRDLRMPENFVLMNYTTSADDPDYIRLVTLDEFDGKNWRPSSPGRPLPGDGELTPPRGLDDSVPRSRETARFQVSEGLRSEWLPIFYPTRRVNAPGDWAYTPSSLEVRAQNGATTTSGIEYTTSYVVPKHRGQDLRAAPSPPADIRERYTRLPDNLPNQVSNLAERLTSDDQTSYDAAVTLQDWFRSEFTYSLDTVPGHSGSHLMDFLKDRRGYCEQFAATMAIMARSLDIPARVAVGYQPGTPLGDSYEVRVQDAHAWPELYFAGHGWVRFEPTPVQQTGSPPEWTSLPDEGEQSRSTPEPTPTTEEPSPEPTRQTDTPEPEESDQAAGGGGGNNGSGLPDLRPVLIGIGALAVLALPGTARVLVRRSRLRGHVDSRAESCWREVADSARDLGTGWPDATTPRAIGSLLSEQLSGEAHQAWWVLVNEVERERYAPEPESSSGISAATGTVLAALFSSAGRLRRIMATVLPLTTLRWFARAPRAMLARPIAAAEQVLTRITSRLRPAADDHTR